VRPHRSRLWQNATPCDPAAFAEQVSRLCGLYRQAIGLQEEGVHLVSTDEKSGLQALERHHPTKPTRPGKIERREQHYTRHGTCCLIANFEVASGRLVRPSVGARRTEADFTAHVASTVASAPEAGWIFIVDNLDIHQSESLVRWVAAACGLAEELGKKESHGILKSKASRAAFLQQATHRIRFVYTPKHASWMNQIELWFSILSRKLLKRASFSSVEELKSRILQFIEYFNCTMARPFRWTYTGRPLQMGTAG
jgi:transposase